MPGGKDNLKPVRTKEEAKERGRNGGIASGEARRKKRSMKQAAKILLDMPVALTSVSDQMQEMFGIGEEDLTNQMAVMVAALKEALNGNMRAAEFLRDTAGENYNSNREYKLQQQESRRRDAEFEYRKQKEAGIEYEIEDLDEIEGVVYGDDSKQGQSAENQPERSRPEEDDTV